ncbi:uncharacterized protein LOC134724486 isoform X3 [Mytilus trossulus]|uniref:uncharacterized protein LOC134724486 isoform X3 n=1 Tax=Mytilus trossulus TaxID=6551 RepID=UPI0030046585
MDKMKTAIVLLYIAFMELFSGTFYVTAARMSTVSSVNVTTNDSSEAAENTTVESVTTSRDVPRASLVIGLVICGLLLACAVIVIVVLIRRRTFKSRPREKIRNTLGGSQDIAVPLITANHSRLMQDDGKNSHTAFAVRLNTTLSDNQALDNDNYSTVDQTAEQRFNETKDDGTRTTDSYMALDPSVTGFNRNLSNTPSVYEFAKPVGDTENNIVDEDRYGFTAEGVYDHSGSNRNEESENTIVDEERYGFTAEGVYNHSGSNRNEESENNIGDEDRYGFTAEGVYNHSGSNRNEESENDIVDEDRYGFTADGVYNHSGSNRNEESDNNIYNNSVDTIYDSGSHKINDETREDGDEDQYVLSDEVVYDHSRIIRHNETEDNNCNNAVDTIYDSGSHKINDETREDTYDHFFGQKTEDQYDISTRT